MLRLYRLLLWLLPATFRREYGDEMCAAVAARWRDVRRAGPGARLAYWPRQMLAIVRQAGLLRMEARPGRERRSGAMEGLAKDARHAVRSFRRSPGFAAITILTLGLGIGASTTIFSAVEAVLFKPLPYEDAERVAVVFQTEVETGRRGGGASIANVADLGAGSARIAWAAAAEPWSLDLQLADRAESLRTWTVSEGFFEAIGTHALLGRTFRPEEYRAGNDRVVLMGHASWLARFGGAPDIVGRVLTLDGEPFTVVGVLPPAFRFPDRAEMWTPRAPRSEDEEGRPADFMTGVVRLAPGVTMEQAQADADRVAAALAEAHPGTNARTGLELVPLREHLLGNVRTPLLVLFGAVGFVLLIACANVAGLMLARGAQRQREYALRSALGAGTARLFVHVALESLVLAVAGCALGVVLTYGGVHMVQSLGPDHLPRIEDLRVDATVLVFAVAVAGLSALLAGLIPSIRLSRPDLRSTLTESSRSATGGRRGRRLRAHLVVAEVAGAVVLLIGAGLLFKSFTVLLGKDLGFDPEGRVAIQVFAYGYPPGGLATFVDGTIENMEALPGVERVALTTNVPAATDGTIASIDIDVPFVIEGRVVPARGSEPITSIASVSGGYFEVMDIPIVAGRTFDTRDHPESPPVVLVNETLARQYFEGDAVGEKITVRYSRAVAREIVGIVRDVRPLGHASEPRAEVYFPLAQVGSGSLTFVVQTAGAVPVPLESLRRAIWQANPAQSIWGAETLESLLGEWLKERRFNLLLLGTFAGIALVLALVGIYGLISYSVEQRQGELGIRRALGGRSGDLLGMILREGAALAAAGVALGIAGAFVLTRFIQGMLFGVEPVDAATFVLLATSVLAVASLAALVPALRAVRVQPMAALRNE